MVSVVGLVGLLVIVLVNSAVTALMTRFFRVRMNTRWGSLVYSILLCPLAMFVLFMVFGVLGFGGGLNLSTTVAVLLAIVVPLVVGMTFDYVWMPSPDEVDLPTSTN
ncbi:hypothetical protein [Haloarcula sp. JP-L23]|uniref:hypothetical protein n=1 Tax=Haloarcula sp. JP-L23 TaxID=2716717 RepID=UPI00140EC60A|nr:hypothetical protein G9465_17490 [Haloarcula sp. JP-L23]